MIEIDTLIAWGASYKKYGKDEPIFMEGDNCYYYYQLVKGKVIWINLNEEGKEFIQHVIEPGECFGELPLFDEGPYAATTIADEDSMVIRLPKSIFLQLVRENPEIHFKFSKLLAFRLRYKFLILKTMAYENPETRISILLKYIKSRKVVNNSIPYIVNLTRQEIANMTGLRVETVIKAIRNLEKKGDLHIEHGKVFI